MGVIVTGHHLVVLGFDPTSLTLGSAFLLGFTVGIVTALRLLTIVFTVSQKVSKPPLDHSGSSGLSSQQTTEAPSPGEPEHP